MSDVHDCTLVTGFPLFTARRMIEKLLRVADDTRVYVLVRHDDTGELDDYLRGLDEVSRKRIVALVGDVTNMDLGLSGREYRALADELSCIHHMAARYHLGASKDEVQQLNVGGTRGVVELALECNRLRRFNFWSTAHVSGERQGVIMEDELYVGQKFRNSYEHSKYAAEKIVRSISRRVPSSILRPGIIVGDSQTGEIDRYDGPYHLIAVLMNSPFDLQLPLPGRGDGPLNLVPVDFVVDMAHAISTADDAVSRTFHLVDPTPLSAKAVFELVANRAERKVPRSVIPDPVAKALLRLPWMGKLKGSPKTIMEGFNQQVVYNCRGCLEMMRAADIWCPQFEHYVDNLVRFVREAERKAHRRGDETIDPLEAS